MDTFPFVLYQTLVEDLSEHLPYDVVRAAKPGAKFEPWPDISYRAFCSIQLLNAFLKKNADSADEEAADARAMEKFEAANNRCLGWKLCPETLFDLHLLGEFENEVDAFWHRNVRVRTPTSMGPHRKTRDESGTMPVKACIVEHPGEILRRATLGNGANVGALGSDYYTKMYSSDLTLTSDTLYSLYARWLVHRDLDYAAEFARLSSGFGVKRVKGSKLSFVPKTTEISRTICTEPTLNMFFQRGIGEILVERIHQRYGIDLKDQPDRNKRLALRGSQGEGFVTLDLESASDSIAIGMVERFLPKTAMFWLKLTRSPLTTTPSNAELQLHMLSSMGNGYTFPLQTSLFCAVVTAAARVHDVVLNRNSRGQDGNWGVFGDDIIVPREISAGVIRLLNLLGFTVNSSKSFVEGHFRESCGGDYWKGSYCRGVYSKTLQSPVSRVVLINRLNHWTGETGISLWRTIQLLKRRVPKKYVPLWENDDAGIRVPLGYVVHGKLCTIRRCKWTGSLLYRRMQAQAQRLVVADGVIRVPRGSRARAYNPAGLLKAFLRGDVVNGVISVRHDATVYRERTGVAPNWDLPALPSKEISAGLRRLENACWMNEA